MQIFKWVIKEQSLFGLGYVRINNQFSIFIVAQCKYVPLAVNTKYCYHQPTALSPEHCPWEDQALVESTTTLLHLRDTSRMEGEHSARCLVSDKCYRTVSDDKTFHSGRYNLQLRPGCQHKFPRVMLDVSHKPGEKRKPSHRHQPFE